MISTALFCLALNVYHESRGEDRLGQFAVAQVTMNRVNEKKQSVCQVVTAHKQFSWTIDGLKPVVQNHKFVGYQLRYSHIPKDMVAWDESVRVASLVLNRKVSDITEGANHYHALRAHKKNWMKKQYIVTTIGHHVFYKFS
jgi:N-acetylmuramoyl-L-alanine amidase